jgi:hypothetical protein
MYRDIHAGKKERTPQCGALMINDRLPQISMPFASFSPDTNYTTNERVGKTCGVFMQGNWTKLYVAARRAQTMYNQYVQYSLG